jgi:hypothetical protein
MPALTWRGSAGTAICLGMLLCTGSSHAQEPSRAVSFAHEHAAPQPIMAIIALRDQHITIYDANGPILRAPVSSGRPGYETPAGIYSVIQKEAEHYSNLYDDASMPFMQRITWSGIALHAGAVPGHPASHGCVRMPYGFAERLFALTKIGMRVVIVRDDMSPAEISHPKLPKPGPIVSEPARAGEAAQELSALRSMRLEVRDAGRDAPPRTWWSIAMAKAAAAEAAANRTEEARGVAIKAGAEAAKAAKAQRRAESARLKREARLESLGRLGRAVEPLAIPPINDLQLRALDELAAASKEVEVLRREVEPKLDAALAARERVKLAQAAWVAARHEAELAEAKAVPISLFISRKAQRLYARQGSGPILESDVAIDSPDEPLGTFVITALGPAHAGGQLRWAVLAMYANPINPGSLAAAGRSWTGPTPTDTSAAKAALDRISIPREVLERVNEFVAPQSSLIISDEELSRETGKDTEFVVLMSGELQGGLKIRRRAYSAF